MRFLKTILACLLALYVTPHSRAVQVIPSITFNLSDFTSQPQRVRTLELYPIGAPFTNGTGGIITRDRVTGATGTNGSIVFSNVYSGPYMSRFQGPSLDAAGKPVVTTNYFSFPDTNGNITASDWTTNSGVSFSSQTAYSQAQADGRFVQKAGGAGSDNTFTRLVVVSNAVIITRGQRATPYPNFTNAIANHIARDRIDVYQSQIGTNSMSLSNDVVIDFHGNWLTNAIKRGLGSPIPDDNIAGALIIPGTNTILRNIKFIGQATLNAIQNSPAVGTVYVNTPQPTHDRILMENCLITNHSVGFYVRTTTPCSGIIRNTDIYCAKDAVFGLEANHNYLVQNCKLYVQGPDPIPGDSGNVAAQAIRILGGTWVFQSCDIKAYSPTNDTPDISGEKTNAIGVFVQCIIPSAASTPIITPEVTLQSCIISTGNTNTIAGTNYVYDIANDFPGIPSITTQPGRVHVSGCTFDRTKVYGGFDETSLPITGGITVGDNTNKLVLQWTGNPDPTATVQTWNIDISSPNHFTNSGHYVLFKTGSHWELDDDLSDPIFTNASAILTNTTFTTVDANGYTALFLYAQSAITNALMVWPSQSAVIANGSGITNLSLPVSSVTNAGTAAYSNASAFLTSAATNSLANTNQARGMIGGGSNSGIGSGTTTYGGFNSANTFGTSASDATNSALPLAKAGIIGPGLYIHTAALGTGTNVVCTVLTNGVASSITATVSGTGVAASDTTHTETVSAGTLVSISFLSANTAVQSQRWTWGLLAP